MIPGDAWIRDKSERPTCDIERQISLRIIIGRVQQNCVGLLDERVSPNKVFGLIDDLARLIPHWELVEFQSIAGTTYVEHIRPAKCTAWKGLLRSKVLDITTCRIKAEHAPLHAGAHRLQGTFNWIKCHSLTCIRPTLLYCCDSKVIVGQLIKRVLKVIQLQLCGLIKDGSIELDHGYRISGVMS